MSATLLLHWDLDELDEHGGRTTLDDMTGAGRSGTVEGPSAAAPDARFGSCLRLGGGAAALRPDDDPALRLEACTWAVWALLDPPSEWPITTASASPLGGQTGGVTLSATTSGALVLSSSAAGGASAPVTSEDGVLTWDTWHHVALTRDGSLGRILVDGKEVAHHPLTAPAAVRGDVVLGRGPGTGTTASTAPGVPGRFAHLRLYDGALTDPEIAGVMADDESALAAFVRAHPISAELVDAAGQAVLYIEDGSPTQKLTLRVSNTTRQDLELRAVPGPPSAENHHLAVRLRPGTLAAGAVPVLADPDWELARGSDGDVLYLRRTAAGTVARAGRVDLPIGGLNADGAGGSHGTRVEVGYAHVGFGGEAQELSGTRLLFLDVVNHRGRPDIPLDVEFVGGDRVLSDGLTDNTLTLRLATVSREAGIPLTGWATARDAATAFVVSFEGQEQGETRDWALTADGAAGRVRLAVAGPGGAAWRVTASDQGQHPVWTLVPEHDTVLTHGASITLTLSPVRALATPGHAPIVVAHRNVPGYQDGHVAMPVERSPLLFTASAAGVGTAPGTSRLTVGADGDHLQLRRPREAAGRGKHVFLELFQDETATVGQLTYPSIRFSHAKNFSVRIEGRPEGLVFKDGDTSSDKLAGITAGTVTLDALRVGGPPAGNELTSNVTVLADSAHLQLRRPRDAAGRGKHVFLELFQDEAAGVADRTFPSIRFHHSNNFWHRIEGRPEGLVFKDGNIPSDTLVGITAGTATLNALRIGNTTIGENELKILAALAAGKLKIELWNNETGKYVWVTNYAPNDPQSNCLMVFPHGTGLPGQPETAPVRSEFQLLAPRVG